MTIKEKIAKLADKKMGRDSQALTTTPSKFHGMTFRQKDTYKKLKAKKTRYA